MYFIQIFLLSVFVLALLFQIYYYLFRFARVSMRSGVSAGVAGGVQEPVSVIISARNELANLEKLLPELMRQEYASFEVIVVDDRSFDGTDDYLKDLKKQYSNLRVITLEQTPPHVTAKKYALTMGIKHAANDLLVFTDADCMPASTLWIAQMAAAFNKNEVKIALGFSQYEKGRGLLNSFIRYETLITGLMYLGSALAGHPYMGVGRNMAYRKSFFLDRKGFIKHRTINGGDDDLFVNQNGNKKNTAVVYGKDSLVLSVPKKNLRDWYRQKLRHMVTGKHYRKATKSFLGFYTAAQLLFWITFITLISLWIEPYLILAGFLTRMLLLYYVIIAGSKKMGEKFGDWKIFLLDFLFVFYYIFVGLAAFFTKKTTWK